MVFADPPDNIKLGYSEYDDDLPPEQYIAWLEEVVYACIAAAPIAWISFNAKYTFEMGRIVCNALSRFPKLEAKPCHQYYTFFEQNRHDLGNAHRPLYRFRQWVSGGHMQLYPDQIRVPSWRMEHGDKRANPNGCVPGDVFDIPRVTGNSRQRRKWHPTQLNEQLVERCIRLSTPDAGYDLCDGSSGKRLPLILDAFGGTGTTLRVAKACARRSVLIEIDPKYCEKIAAEHHIPVLELE